MQTYKKLSIRKLETWCFTQSLTRHKAQHLRGVSTKLNKYIVFTMQTYKKLINCLLANPDKTKIIFFGTPQMLKQIPVDISFMFLGKTIQAVQNAKDLGLT